jgi:transcriptional regulator with XRE-family HTH domain
VLIRLVREARGIKIPEAASRAGISKGRWSQVELGYESRDKQYKPVKGSAGVIAHMADQIGLPPERLETEGERPDAAEVLREIRSWKADQDLHPPGEAPPPAEGVTKPPDVDGFVRPTWLDWREAKARELEQEFRLLTHRDIFSLIATVEREMADRASGLSHTREVEAEIRHLRDVTNGS